MLGRVQKGDNFAFRGGFREEGGEGAVVRNNSSRGKAEGTLVSYVSYREDTGYFQPAGLSRPAAGQPGTPLAKENYTVQSIRLREGMRKNSRVLLVTRGIPNDTACEAISMSMEPMGVPSFSSDARISP